MNENAWAVYVPDSGHLWNRLFHGLFGRITADSKEYGYDNLDPLLWRETSHLLSEPSHSEAIRLLDEFLWTPAERQVRDPVRRAMLQRDLWAVFDWLTVRSDTYPEQREALKARLVPAIRTLALTRDEIRSLPDNYASAVQSGLYPSSHSGCYLGPAFLPPGLPDATGDWVALGRDGGPIAISHVQDIHFLGRSAFLVHIRVPGGREKTLQFVEQMRARTAHDVPVGTEVALVRRMQVIDDQGEIVAAPIVEALEIRRFNFSLPGSQDFYKFALDRRALFAGDAGGLRLSGPEFLLFSSHEVDVFDIGPGVGRHQATVPTTCQACHSHPSLANSAAQSILSYGRALFPVRDGQSTAVRATSPEAENRAVIDWKMKQPSWTDLPSLWTRKGLVDSRTASTGCPVTLPVAPEMIPDAAADKILAGSSPIDRSRLSMYGNDAIWVTIPPDGVVIGVARDGGIFDKFLTVHLVHGGLTAWGRRLDGPSSRPDFGIPDGYGTIGFQAFGVLFPTAGCWEITQRVDGKELTFVVRVVGPNVGPSAECDRTPFASTKPDQPSIASFTTTWYSNPEGTLWAGLDRAHNGRWVSGSGTKVLWVKPERTAVEARATSLGFDDQIVHFETSASGYFEFHYQASGIKFPSAGCWLIDASAGSQVLTFIVLVEPE